MTIDLDKEMPWILSEEYTNMFNRDNKSEETDKTDTTKVKPK